MPSNSSHKVRALVGEPLPVVALVYDGLCTFEYGIVAEVFGLKRPELGRELYRFSSVALQKGSFKAAGGLTVQASGTKKDWRKAHTIVIPGWCDKNEPVPEAIIKPLRQAHEKGTRIVSICSGGYVLAAAGLLEQRRATTHWQYASDFQSRYPNIIVEQNHLYIDEDNIVTSAGSSAGIDACLHIVRTDYGAKVANLVARRLVMHSHRQGSQAQFIETPAGKSGSDLRLTQLMQEIRSNLNKKHTIESMANSVSMSTRTLQRRFFAHTGTSVVNWITQEKIACACQLLESTNHSIEHISTTSGFASVDALRYHFRQSLETSPAEYRKRFRQTDK